jgi:hypothetical protein
MDSGHPRDGLGTIKFLSSFGMWPFIWPRNLAGPVGQCGADVTAVEFTKNQNVAKASICQRIVRVLTRTASIR